MLWLVICFVFGCVLRSSRPSTTVRPAAAAIHAKGFQGLGLGALVPLKKRGRPHDLEFFPLNGSLPVNCVSTNVRGYVRPTFLFLLNFTELGFQFDDLCIFLLTRQLY